MRNREIAAHGGCNLFLRPKSKERATNTAFRWGYGVDSKRFAEKGEHNFRQKVCKICGKPFWPSNGQEVLCSEECKTINRNQRQLAYYHRKQSEQKAGEAI